MDSKHVAVVGEMGVGKTTVGRLIAQALGRPFLDSDAMIEAEVGITASDVAARAGVGYLHDLELEVFVAMSRSTSPSVLAPAASVVDREEGRDILRGCTTIWLTAPVAVVDKRRRRSGHRRAVGDEEREELEERRVPHLEKIADVCINTGASGPEEVLGLAIGALRDLS